MADRRDYWNQKYAEYWKEVTCEANDEDGIRTKVIKSTKGDYKTVGDDTAFLLFNELQYDMEQVLLDYGCGFGRFFEYFNKKINYIGIDISESMIKECKKNFPMYEDKFIVSEGEALPFEDCSFDKIICFGVFDACYQEMALLEMLRVVKIGGEILITGKNSLYHKDDEQAYIAENAARIKGHPNYFTDVDSMICQLEKYCKVKKQKYYKYRGDFGQNKYVEIMPKRFYEFEIVIEKQCNMDGKFEIFSNPYSNTWHEIEMQSNSIQ